MAKVRPNPLSGHFRGKIDCLVYRHVYGRTVASYQPDRGSRVPSDAEALAIARFRNAALRAKVVSPERKLAYQARARALNRPEYSVRTADVLNPPTIEWVELGGYTGRPGEIILVCARDDFEVKSVTVCVTLADRTEIESGPATRVSEDLFKYVTLAPAPPGAALRVEVAAMDWPENRTIKVFEWKVFEWQAAVPPRDVPA